MAKYTFNYDSGEYEYIERDGFSIDRGEYDFEVGCNDRKCCLLLGSND